MCKSFFVFVIFISFSFLCFNFNTFLLIDCYFSTSSQTKLNKISVLLSVFYFLFCFNNPVFGSKR